MFYLFNVIFLKKLLLQYRFAYLNLLSQLDEKVRKEEEVEKVNDKEL